MATATKIATTKSQIRDAVRSRVYRSDTLGADWQEVPYLYADDLALRACPGVDQCQMSYVYGEIAREDGTPFQLYEPLTLIGSYLKVVLEKATLDGQDITWYGICEIDDSVPHGSGPNADLPRGRQRFTAFGLARLLERAVVMSCEVDASQNATYPEQRVVLEQGAEYNQYHRRTATRQGNRTADPQLGNPNLTYWLSRTVTSDSKWTADDIVRALLKLTPPVDGNDEPVCDWVLDGEPGDTRLAWYEPVLRTDGRTLKQVLDEAIPVRRGLGYTIRYEETPGPRGRATIVPFSFGADDILLPEGKILPGNADPVELDFETALDVQARIVESVTTSYDEVVAIGNFATSTCTLAFGQSDASRGAPFQFRPDWTDALETSYKEAASNVTGYSSAYRLTQYEWNTRWRQRDELRPVFRRYRLYDHWDGLVWDYTKSNTSATKYWFNPPWPDDPNTGKPARDTDPLAEPIQPYSDKEQAPPYAPSRLVVESFLPFVDGCNYTGDRIASRTWEEELPEETDWQYLPPFLYAVTDASNTSAIRHDALERLAEQSSNERQRRRWSATLRPLPDRGAVEINVSGAPQHFLARSRAPAMAAIEPYNDPTKEQGIDWVDVRATVCLRLPWRVQHRIRIRETPIEGRPWRVQFIPVEARLDYVVPDTVVRLAAGLVELSSGGFVRDDRGRLTEIAQAAARWYQTERQTLFFALRGVVETVQLGQLITSVGGRYTLEGINTPVTGIRYDLNRQTTELETSMAELDFA
jgi:hypothetical protein